MKKILTVVLCIGMLLSLGACGNGGNNEQTSGDVKTESKENIKKISKEKYEKMTADDLFNAVVKSPDSVTLEEYIAITETLQYSEITESLNLKKNITDELLKKISKEYDSEHRPNPKDWVPVLINHEAPQVRGKAFGNAHYLYIENPEFLAAAKEVMKTETEPYVIYHIIRQLPVSIVANDPEIAEFVQKMANHENSYIKKTAESTLKNVAEAK